MFRRTLAVTMTQNSRNQTRETGLPQAENTGARDYFSAILAGLADLPIRCLSEVFILFIVRCTNLNICIDTSSL